MDDTDIDKIYGKDWEQNKVTNVEEIRQTKEKNETKATLENIKITEGTTNKVNDKYILFKIILRFFIAYTKPIVYNNKNKKK